MSDLNFLKETNEAPMWLLDAGFKTISKGYLLEGETPRTAFERVAKTVAARLKKPELADKFFDYMWKGWFGLASPVLSNIGADRGLPISCYTIHPADSITSIFGKAHELACLSKGGGGVGIYLGDLRGRGSLISGGRNGVTDGIVPWAKVYDSTTVSVSQGSTRRGASALYLDVAHKDFDEFIRIRRPQGDINRQCLNTHHGICIDDAFMVSLKEGDKENRRKWEEILRTRIETGEPYLFFTDNVNRQNPQMYKDLGFKVSASNICCLSGDTLVATKDGAKRIDSLVGKRVDIYDGQNWVKNSSFELRGFGKLIRIYLADGSHVDSTNNHRWFVSNNYTEIRSGKISTVFTEDLQIGQYVEYHKEEFHGVKKAKAAYLKGFLCGDGTNNKVNAYLNLHFPKFMCADQLVESANELDPIANSRYVNTILDASFGEIKDITDSSNAIGRQIFRNMKGLSARKELGFWSREYKRSLPEEIFDWNRESKIQFLSGLLDSDGTVSKNTLQITNVSKNFVLDVVLMLKTCGVSCSVDVANSKFRLTISATDSYRIKKELICRRINLSRITKPNRFLTTFRKIVKIENLEGVHPVYCPTVESTGKFALANGLMTGNSEITGYTDPEHTFVCCLSSLNLARWDEWKNTDLVYYATWFLDGVLEEYIAQAEHLPGMEAAVRFAKKGRMLGLGVFGFHSLLQDKLLAFDDMQTRVLNRNIFKHIRAEADRATKDLATEYGEPEWCRGSGRRNTHCLAVAPTVTNSKLVGQVSPSIEPWPANVYVDKTAKGVFIVKNTILERELEKLGQNIPETWKKIANADGSVQGLDIPEELKAVFQTAKEINQFTLITLAADRQQFIDQAQSLNLFFPANASAKYIHEVHYKAWELGIKTLYYYRTESVLKGDRADREYHREDVCVGCDG